MAQNSNSADSSSIDGPSLALDPNLGNDVENESQTNTGDVTTRITQLADALSTAKIHILEAREENKLQIGLVIAICIMALAFGLYLGVKLFHIQVQNDWSISKTIFISFTRGVLVTSAFYLISFLFKLLKSYLHIYQRNCHRLMVVNSMASLVESASKEEREKIYHKLLDIIISFDKNGVMKDGEKEVDTAGNEIIVELIKKIPVPKI